VLRDVLPNEAVKKPVPNELRRSESRCVANECEFEASWPQCAAISALCAHERAKNLHRLPVNPFFAPNPSWQTSRCCAPCSTGSTAYWPWCGLYDSSESTACCAWCWQTQAPQFRCAVAL